MGRRGDQNTSSRLSDAEYFAALEECTARAMSPLRGFLALLMQTVF